MLYRNTTGAFKSFSIPMPDGSYRNISAAANAVVDVPLGEIERAEGFGFEALNKPKPKPVVAVVIPKKPTEKELLKLNDVQQEKILKALGVKHKTRTEKERVALILKLQ